MPPASRPVPDPDAPIDPALIERARHAAPDAIGILYRRYAPGLSRLARGLLGSAADADLLHDLFLGLPELLRRYEHRDRLEPGSKRS